MGILFDKGTDYEDEKEREKESNVKCECGERRFLVNHLSSGCNYTGGFTKITCLFCKTSEILMDDCT